MKVLVFLLALALPANAENVKPSPELRAKLIQALDENFLKSGMNVNLAMMGEAKDIFWMEYVLSSRSFVYKFVNETPIVDSLKRAGFREARFTNGHGDNFCLNVAKRAFVDCH